MAEKVEHLPADLQKIIAEKLTVDGNLESLSKIMASEKFADLPEDEQKRASQQFQFMHGYSTTLGERVQAFFNKPEAVNPGAAE